jgi:hypothetical protein
MVTVMLPLAGATALMDPTRPYDASWSARQSGHTSSGWVLNSTLVSPHRRLAVINGVHVAEGESIGSATVLRIRKLDVLLQAPNKRIRLKLLPGNVRKQP